MTIEELLRKEATRPNVSPGPSTMEAALLGLGMIGAAYVIGKSLEASARIIADNLWKVK